MKLVTGLAVLTVAVASAYSLPSSAALELHGNGSNPAARCQGALPVFETAIRKRPLAIVNEGTSNSFVSCGFEYDVVDAEDNAPDLLDTYFSNRSAAPITVSCTAVTGFDTGINEFVSLTTDTIAPGAQGNLFWEAADFPNDGLLSGLISISCDLPAGAAINDTYIWWLADDA